MWHVYTWDPQVVRWRGHSEARDAWGDLVGERS